MPNYFEKQRFEFSPARPEMTRKLIANKICPHFPSRRRTMWGALHTTGRHRPKFLFLKQGEHTMPTPAYMTIMGERQGNITAGNFTEASVGNIYQEGHEDEILVQAFSHEIMLPRDSQSGQPTGQRVHHPLHITKVMDKCSPCSIAL
jgi:hypothetical protein